jgi:hypothetical protein
MRTAALIKLRLTAQPRGAVTTHPDTLRPPLSISQRPHTAELSHVRKRDLSRARAATPPNPEPLAGGVAQPTPISTPSTEPPTTIRARVFAYLDLPPQCEIGRDVQRARPYDGQGWCMHPKLSPLGRGATGRARLFQFSA